MDPSAPWVSLWRISASQVSQVFLSSEKSNWMENWGIHFYCVKGSKATVLKVPLLLTSSLILERRWTRGQRNASLLLFPSVRPSLMSAACVKRLPHPLRLLSLMTRPHVGPQALNMTDSISKCGSLLTIKKKKKHHCDHCDPQLFRSAEEPSNLPQPFHWHAGLSFSSFYLV